MADQAPVDLSLNPFFVAVVVAFLAAVAMHGVQLLFVGATANSVTAAGAAVCALLGYFQTQRRAKA